MKTYKVIAAVRFERMLIEEQDWWYANRDKNIHALDDELEHVIWRLKDSPWTGIQVEGEPQYTRSLLIKKTHHRVAYDIDDSNDQVELLAIWGLYKRDMPKLH